MGIFVMVGRQSNETLLTVVPVVCKAWAKICLEEMPPVALEIDRTSIAKMSDMVREAAEI